MRAHRIRTPETLEDIKRDARRWAVAEAIAYRTDGEAMLYHRDLDYLTTEAVWRQARGDVDMLAAIWCARDDFRNLPDALRYFVTGYR